MIICDKCTKTVDSDIHYFVDNNQFCKKCYYQWKAIEEKLMENALKDFIYPKIKNDELD